MNIPKGTIRIVYQEAARMYLKNFRTWAAMSALWCVWAGILHFFYFNNNFVISWLNKIFFMGFFIVDFILTLSFFVALGISLIATLLMFETVERGEKIPPVLKVYATASGLLWPLLVLKIRYVLRICGKLLLLVVPGVFALTDGIAFYFAFLFDRKQGREAIAYSEKVVRVNRVRYWDYLLVGFLLPCTFVLPLIILVDQVTYFLGSHNLYVLSLAVENLQYIALYFSLVYFLVFHYRVYLKFKTFLASS